MKPSLEVFVDSTMMSRPAPPPAVRTALALIAVLILYRLYLIGSSLLDYLPALDGTGGGDPWGLWLRGRPRIPGGLGNPVLSMALLPVLIGARVFLRRGYRLAAHIVLGFLAARALLIVLRGPWNLHAALLMLLMTAIATLLLRPRSRAWLDTCARQREARLRVDRR